MAQPSISASEHVPTIGTSRTLQFQNLTQAPPPGGADVIWDFSSLVSAGSEVVTYLLPSSTPAGALFAAATVAEQAGGGDVRYLSLGSEGLEEHGVATTLCTYVWSNTLLLLPSSITYNQDFADDYAGSCSVGVGTVAESGDVEIVADGWGSLMMPTGTYANVLRVRSTRNFGAGFGVPSAFFRQETLDYYAPAVAGPVLQTVRLFQNVNGNLTQLSNTANYILDPSLGSHSRSDEFIRIVPNPTSGHVTIGWSASIPKINRVEIIDARGVLHRAFPVEVEASQVLDLSDLRPGCYSVRLFATDKVLTSRLVKL